MEGYAWHFHSGARGIYGNRSRNPVVFSGPDCVKAHIRQGEAWQGLKCRLCKKEALHEVNTTAAKRIVFVDCFYPFGDQLAAERTRQLNHELHDSECRRPLRKITGQIHIEFDDVGREVGQQVKAAVARTDIIQSDLEPALPINSTMARICARSTTSSASVISKMI